jgi:hypothetical protein
MGYTDLDRRRDGIIAGANVTGSFDQNAIPYQYAGAYGTETRVQFPFESQWIQITAITSDTVKYSFRNAGTAGSNYGAVGGNSTTHVMHVKASEIYVLNDAAITVGMSLIPSGTNIYDMDTRY